MVNFYHQCIPRCSEILAPLSKLLKNKKKNDKITWTEQTENMFEVIKANLNKITSLAMLQEGSELKLTTDASATAIGAVLEQSIEGNYLPIGFHSRKLKSQEQRYSTYDRELLAIYDSIKHFKNLIENRQFDIFTDHKPLVHALEMKNPSPRQQRQINWISQFDCKIKYIAGKSNVVADFLSRTEINEINFSPVIKIGIIKDNQEEVLAEALKTKSLEVIEFNGIWYDISIKNNIRPLIPEKNRKECFDSVHQLGHYGIHTTYNMIHLEVCWPSMRKDIKNWVKDCKECNLNKITQHPKLKKINFENCDKLEVIHLDIVGPLPTNKNKKYLITIIDRNTGWFEVIPTKEITAEKISKIVDEQWITRYGPPKKIITDQGPQFESEIFKKLCERNSIRKARTTTYNPQCNGKIERFHRTLKETLNTFCNDKNWLENLNKTLLGLRLKTKSNSNESPLMKLTGKNHFKITDKEESRPTFKEIKTTENIEAYIKKPFTRNFENKFEGPYLVKILTNNTALLDINGKDKYVNLRRIKLIQQNNNKHTPDTNKNKDNKANDNKIQESCNFINKKTEDDDTFRDFTALIRNNKNNTIEGPFKIIEKNKKNFTITTANTIIKANQKRLIFFTSKSLKDTNFHTMNEDLKETISFRLYPHNTM